MADTERISALTFEDKPPTLIFTVPKKKDLPRELKPSRDVVLPIDILLLTVKDCEFLNCYRLLKNCFKSHIRTLGYVIFGCIGEDEQLRVRVALIKCYEGSTTPGGSTIVVKNAVGILRPKAVFSVGFCGGLQRSTTRLGDVVVCAKLTQYASQTVQNGEVQPTGAVRVPVSRDMSDLIKHAADGWTPPLFDPSAREVDVHCDGEYLSGPENVRTKQRCDELVHLYPNAKAIEMEGEGVYVAAYDMKMEWVVVKGISGYADGTESYSEEWKTFASAMAASVVANMLYNPIVFQRWQHYKGEPATIEQMSIGNPCEEPSEVINTLDTKVKQGIPTDEDLERISYNIAVGWMPLGRRLKIEEPRLVAFHKENEEYGEKAYQMLLHWKQREGSDATFLVLHDALCDPLVKRKDLAETYCCH